MFILPLQGELIAGNKGSSTSFSLSSQIDISVGGQSLAFNTSVEIYSAQQDTDEVGKTGLISKKFL